MATELEGFFLPAANLTHSVQTLGPSAEDSAATAAFEPKSVAAGSALQEFIRHWPVLVGSALGASLGLAVYPLYVMPVIGLQLEHLLGWSRIDSASLSTALILGGLVSIMFAGRIVDAVGPRWPAVISTAAIGMLLLAAPLLPRSANAWRWGVLLFSVLGCATGPMTYSRAICNVFTRARGLALGLTFGSVGLVGAILPSVLSTLIGRFGPGHALQTMGVGYILMLSPLVAILLRSSARPSIAAAEVTVDGGEATVTPLARSRWVGLAFGFMLLTVAGYAAGVSFPGLAHDAGLASPALASAVLALTIMAARPIVGIVIDLAPAQIVSAILASCTAGGLLTVAVAPHLLPFGAALVGLSLGADSDVIPFLVSRYATQARQSRVLAQLYMAIGICSALAPLGFAKARALSGGYQPVLLAAVVATLAAAALIGTLPTYASRPQKSQQ